MRSFQKKRLLLIMFPVMDENRFIYLVSKKLTDSASEAEALELEILLNTNKYVNELYKALFADGLEWDDDMLEAQQSFAAHYVKMQLAGKFAINKASEAETSPLKKRSVVKLLWPSVAAVFLIIVLVAGIVFVSNRSSEKPLITELKTDKGKRLKTVLPDGTLVWLNADSKISYSGNLEGQKREIQLSGEAFFDVAKDEKRPFIVHTANFDVHVLGTVFNVRSYADERTTETSLIKGAIQVVINNKEDKKILLHENEKIKVANVSGRDLSQKKNATEEKDIMNNDVYAYTLDSVHFQKNDTASMEVFWTMNKLVFESEDLETVIAKIARWYNVDIELRNEELKSRHFTAVFENKTLQEVLEMLKQTGKLNYSNQGSKVIIY